VTGREGESLKAKMLQVCGGRSVSSIDSSLAMLHVDYLGESPDVTVQGWQRVDLNSEPSMISDLDEKVLPLYRQGPPIHFQYGLKFMMHPWKGYRSRQAGISLRRSQSKRPFLYKGGRGSRQGLQG
jgi:hypothetical protein